ncbi:hypothetical protein KUTeg_007566 [Tegillarca granosa]|uniref:Uncharacterized protein n=1 Tax=Tegillarca granosa TaxID=220873 RepID=A0ABQ9FGY7_TEGGR|nr:hypothetical protein KUTeg_007566 [Tegillarca granosa]
MNINFMQDGNRRNADDDICSLHGSSRLIIKTLMNPPYNIFILEVDHWHFNWRRFLNPTFEYNIHNNNNNSQFIYYMYTMLLEIYLLMLNANLFWDADLA